MYKCNLNSARLALCTLRRCTECNDRCTQQGIDEQWIQFQQHRPDKTVLGCLLLSALLLILKRPLHTAKWFHAAVCAFLGIFVLFHFETSAYSHYAAAGVVVILMASASISSILLGRIVLKDQSPPMRQ